MKMKKMMLLVILLSLFLLAACSDEEVKPEERFTDYVEHWLNQDFNAMYQMLSDQTKTTYSSEAFVDRYEKIYQDLSVSNLDLTYQLPETEESDEHPTAFPLTVSKDTVAGEVSFDSVISLVEQVDEEDNQDWYIEWDPGLIFPELKEGADVALNYTEPKRGEIYDRNGFGLAINDTVYNIGVQPGLFQDQEEEVEEIAQLLRMSVTAIEHELSASWVTDDVFVPLKKVSPHDEALLDELFAIPAVIRQEVTGRAYPLGEAAAHLIGYISGITAEELAEQEPGQYHQNDVIGKRGLEQLFESRLRGERGVRIDAVTENSRTPITETEAVNGEDITLTIDADFQQKLFESYQGDAGTSVALDPKTGETLALVSSPAFDPHTFTYGISQSEWDTLQEDEKEPLLNRFASTFSPGSTIKPITGAIGLSEGTIVPDEGITIDGLTWSRDGWGSYVVRRVSESSEPVDLRDALIRSDNIFFAQKMIELGSENFVKGLKQFGFGEPFPYTYPIQRSTISNDGSIDRETLLADSAYGQGEIQMSALHLATTYTALLNEGSMIQPVLEVDEPTGEFSAEGLIAPEHATLMRDALRQVVISPNGTAQAANVDFVELSGKTGTAELKHSLTDETGQENGWFVAYPSDERVLVAMMVEHVEDKGGSGYVVEKGTSFFENIQ